jgi:O-antigen ligase
MAWISLAKVLMFVSGLAYLIAGHFKNRSDAAFEKLWTPRLVLLILIAFALSLLWTVVDLEFALLAFVKHGKLMEILLLLSLIRTTREARIGITAFATGQVFLLLSSWLLVLGVPVPWSVDSIDTVGKFAVFSTYLDQSIMFATVAAVFWHLRSEQLWPRLMGGLLAVVTLITTLLLLEGRSGYVVALAMVSLAAMWAMPKRWRLATLVVTPIIVLFGLYIGSSHVQERVSKILRESQTYARQGENISSSGWRLNAWHRSLQAMQDKPWLGHGVGSWTPAVKKHEGATAIKTFGAGNSSNPHQEYLLWGVELGAGGPFLLLALLASVMRDAQRFSPSIKQATLSVMAAMAVACLFNSALYDDLMGDFFCITLGLLMAMGLRGQSPQTGATISAPGKQLPRTGT